MGNFLNEKILNAWKAAAHSSRIPIPRGFLFSEGPDGLTMTFRSEEGMGLGGSPCNMQEDSGAFEGWALALYVHYLNRGGTVRLDIPEDAPPDGEGRKFGHYSRFLYRALRFSQYPWFQLSDRLRERVEAFDAFLKSHDFTNNMPKREAGDKATLESRVEVFFTKDAALANTLNADGIYRQLPVGLFLREKDEKQNRVFPGRASAIDLWAVSDDVLTVIELKAGDNQKIGALTELFFYANYVYDMFVRRDNRFYPQAGSRLRGYDVLQAASQSGALKKVQGYLLANQGSRHPLVTDSVLEELNRGAITYGCLEYELTAVPL